MIEIIEISFVATNRAELEQDLMDFLGLSTKPESVPAMDPEPKAEEPNVVEMPKPEEPKTEAPKYSVDAVRDLLKQIRAKTGNNDAIREILTKHGLKSAAAIPDEKLDAVFADAQEALNAAQ